MLEVIAEDWMRVSKRDQRALRALAEDKPLVLHGVAVGLASAAPADAKRLDRMARLFETVRPFAWSEHLAFVRGGGVEIGHLAAPPRNADTVEGTLVDPRDRRSVRCPDAARFAQPLRQRAQFRLRPLHAAPCDATRTCLDGPLVGRAVAAPGGAPARLLDDHVHDVPDPVFALLEELARSAPQPLTVILERDGRYPDFEVLLAQVERARAALRQGRLLTHEPLEQAA